MQERKNRTLHQNAEIYILLRAHCFGMTSKTKEKIADTTIYDGNTSANCKQFVWV